MYFEGVFIIGLIQAYKTDVVLMFMIRLLSFDTYLDYMLVLCGNAF